MAKRRKVRRVSQARVYGGAFGRKKRGPGSHVLRRGAETNKYSQHYLVYDRARILAAPISIPVAHTEMLIDFAEWSDMARDFFKSKGVDQDPIIHVGALGLNRGRIMQPWGEREYLSENFVKAAAELINRLRSYTKFADIATTRATRKTGVIGWFLRARTRPFGAPIEPKRQRKKKGKRRANSRTAKKKATARKSVSSVGRGSKTNVRRGTNQHGVARRRTVRRGRARKS